MELKEYTQKKKKLGELLVNYNFLEKDELKRFLEIQKEFVRPLGSILIEKNVIDEEKLVKILSVQFNVPYTLLKHHTYDAIFDKIVPKELYTLFDFIPYHFSEDDRTLTIAINEPNNFLLLENIRKMTNCKIKYILAPLKKIVEIKDKIKSSFQRNISNENVKQEKSINKTPLKMAFSIMETAVFEKASEIYFNKNKNGYSVFFKIFMKPYSKFIFDEQQGTDIIDEFKKLGNIKLTFNSRDHYFSIKEISDISICISIRELKRDLLNTLFEENEYEKLVLDIERGGIIGVCGALNSGKRNTLANIALKCCCDHATIFVSDIIESINENIVCIKNSEYNIDRIISIILSYEPQIVFFDVYLSDADIIKLFDIVQMGITVFIKFSSKSIEYFFEKIRYLSSLKVENYIRGAVYQKMILHLCNNCKLTVHKDNLHIALPQANDIFFDASGCSKCNYTGYTNVKPAALYTSFFDKHTDTSEQRMLKKLSEQACAGTISYRQLVV